MLNSPKRNTHLIETSYDRLKSEKSHFSNTGKILLKQEFSDGLQISMNIKDITIPLIIHYTTLRAFRTLLPNLSTLNHNVRFLPCQHRGVGIIQYVYALNPVCIVLIIPGHSRREVPRRGCGHSWSGNTMTIRRTWHTLININNVNFNSLFRVCLIFYTYDSANFKKHPE